MTVLTVHLSRVTNLTDQARYDKADPYVKFELEQDSEEYDEEFEETCDEDFGVMVSSKKMDEQNPVYNETFKFDLPTLENVCLKCTVMDDDFGADDTLGKCVIALEDLDLSSELLEVRRKVDDNRFSPDSWIHLKLSYGDVEDEDDLDELSHIGIAAYERLRELHAEHHGRSWNVSRGKLVGEVQQTPLKAFPGGPTHPEGHDDWFPELMGEVLGRTRAWADVLSLGAPDGRFMTAFKAALGTIAEEAEGRDEPVVVRMMFGNIVGMPTNCNGVRDELTKDLPEDANVRLWVGAWRRGVSWNHSKILSVDGKYLHTGGHNMWDAHYLKHDPVHDVSLELEGSCALDGHRYADRQWNFIESSQETFWGTVGSKMPDHLPQAAPTRVTVSEWPPGVASEHAPYFKGRLVEDLAEDVDDAVPVITMGRYGALTEVDRPSDDAFLAMFDAAETVVRLVLQDLGPVCIPSTKRALPGLTWPKPYLAALGRAIWERGVDVEIVLSNPRSIPAGLSPTEAQYGNGWDCSDVAAEIIKTIVDQFPDYEDDVLREKVADNLRVCFLREECGNSWEDGETMGLHSKHFIVDDVAAYVGSQNLYVCDLAEWGVLIDDEDTVQRMMDEYWRPMWEYSYKDEDTDVDAVMDGLGIDRDGEDVDEIDDETMEMMKNAELANAGHAEMEFYEDTDY